MKLHDFAWADVLALGDTNKAYDDFLNIFSTYDNENFPKAEIKLKRKSVLSPRITKRILKSSNEKFLKNRTPKNEKHYKENKNLSETIKPKSKKCYFANQ